MKGRSRGRGRETAEPGIGNQEPGRGCRRIPTSYFLTTKYSPWARCPYGETWYVSNACSERCLPLMATRQWPRAALAPFYGSSLFSVGGSIRIPRGPVGYEDAFNALSASSGKFARPQLLNRGLDDVLGKLYYILAGSEDRATQACDPSADPVVIRRDGLGPVPSPLPSRWQPLSDKRKPDTSAGLRIAHTKQR